MIQTPNLGLFARHLVLPRQPPKALTLPGYSSKEVLSVWLVSQGSRDALFPRAGAHPGAPRPDHALSLLGPRVLHLRLAHQLPRT